MARASDAAQPPRRGDPAFACVDYVFSVFVFFVVVAGGSGL
jgi:hypothetical protein